MGSTGVNNVKFTKNQLRIISNFYVSHKYKECKKVGRGLFGKEVSGEGGTEGGEQKEKLTKIHYKILCHCQTKKKN